VTLPELELLDAVTQRAKKFFAQIEAIKAGKTPKA
jgi:hypothetical protein